MTVPEHTLSLREILNKHSQGIPLPNARDPYFELDSDADDDGFYDGIDIRTLDLSERYNLIRERQAELNDIKKEYAERRKKLREKPTEKPTDNKQSEEGPGVPEA